MHRADGVVVVRRSAERKAKPSVAQNVNRSGFAISQLYVRRVKADPELYEPYKRAARITRKRACDLALADALCPPVIRNVDMSAYTGKAGEGIHIDAVDNFAIHSVHVRLDLIDGTLIEEGVAVCDIQLALWVYVTQSILSPGTAVVVHITALDGPGNAAIKTLHHVPAAV